MGMPQSNIDWSRYMDGLNGKMNKDFTNMPSGKDAVIEYKVNSDGSWYRRYKSGWLEQGGEFHGKAGVNDPRVTLVKPFANTKYFANIIGNEWHIIVDPTHITTTTIQIQMLTFNWQNNTYTGICRWYACGQGA